MLNNVVLVGRMVRDPELRYTSSNIATVSFSVAVDRRYNGSNGERVTDFINCVAWRQSAEFMSKYIHQGDLISVTGQIQTRNYQGNDGVTRYVTEVVCDNISIEASKQTGDRQAPATQSQPRRESQAQPETFEISDVAEDDLPF